MPRFYEPPIVAVLHSAGLSGPAKTLQPRLRRLAEDAELEVVLPGPGPAAELYASFATVTTLSFAPLTRPRGVLELVALAGRLLRETVVFWRRLGRRPPDVVVVGSSYLPAALLAARLRRLPVAVYVGEILRPEERLADRLLVRVLGSASALVACSHTAAAPLRDLQPTVIYPSVSPARPGPDREEARQRFGVPDGRFCVAAVGNLTEGRGQDVLLRAVALLPDVCCVIAGEPHSPRLDQPYADSLRALADELGIAERVRFAGLVTGIEELYAATDVVVNPARFAEPFGRVAVEALAAGRPVVATTVGAIPELLHDGRDALLVPPEDPRALAVAIERLAGDPMLRDELVRGGADVVAGCDVEAGVEAFAAVIARIRR